jgi:hypothetical protein
MKPPREGACTYVKNAPFYCYSVQKYEIVLKNANLLTKIFLCGTKKAHKYA